jgi:hypothetical protein
LALQRLASLGYKPGVLHRDDRLRGEVLEERDLLVGERADFGAVDRQNSEKSLLLPESDPQHRTGAPQHNECSPCGVPLCSFGSKIGYVRQAFALNDSAPATPRSRWTRLAQEVRERGGNTARRQRVNMPLCIRRKRPEARLAEHQRLFQHLVEYRSEIAGRRIDDLQDFGGRGLPLQCLVALVQCLVTLVQCLIQRPAQLGKLALEISVGPSSIG